LASGQVSTGTVLKIKTGSVLKVRIEDAGKLVDKKTNAGTLPHLSMGIFIPGKTFHPVHLKASDGSGSDYQVTIPWDTPVRFSIQSKDLKLSDNAGAALTSNAGQAT